MKWCVARLKIFLAEPHHDQPHPPQRKPYDLVFLAKLALLLMAWQGHDQSQIDKPAEYSPKANQRPPSSTGSLVLEWAFPLRQISLGHYQVHLVGQQRLESPCPRRILILQAPILQTRQALPHPVDVEDRIVA